MGILANDRVGVGCDSSDFLTEWIIIIFYSCTFFIIIIMYFYPLFSSIFLFLFGGFSTCFGK